MPNLVRHLIVIESATISRMLTCVSMTPPFFRLPLLILFSETSFFHFFQLMKLLKLNIFVWGTNKTNSIAYRNYFLKYFFFSFIVNNVFNLDIYILQINVIYTTTPLCCASYRWVNYFLLDSRIMGLWKLNFMYIINK